MHEAIIKSVVFSNSDGLVHGISTKLGGNEAPPYYNNMSYYVGDDKEKVKNNRDIFFGSLGIDQQRIAVPQQVHSDNVKIIDKPGYYTDTDALITTVKNLFLIISTADCYSILIHDARKEIVSAVHSGWRGTQKKILTKTINLMMNELDSNPGDMKIFVGPGISMEHFEVGKEVAELFDSKFIFEQNGSVYINLKSQIYEQLLNLGMSENNVELSPYCSYVEKDYLHSYRRDRNHSGRMFSVIGMKA
jgi:YfiH family protein